MSNTPERPETPRSDDDEAGFGENGPEIGERGDARTEDEKLEDAVEDLQGDLD